MTESIQKSVPKLGGRFAMTLHTAPCDAPSTTTTTLARGADVGVDSVGVDSLDELEGWQALALVSLGRLLTGTELAAVESLPTELALDLLFPDLPDPARQEALWALG